MPWLSSVFKKFDPRALVGAVWHLILGLFHIRAASVWSRTAAATQRYPDDTLEALRKVADPSAETVVRNIVKATAIGGDDPLQAQISAGAKLLATISDSANVVLDPDNHPPATRELIRDWMIGFGSLPTDASIDRARLRRASEFFTRNSFLIALVFGTSSLLEAYACPKGVLSLAATDNLITETHRRLAETMQWVLIVEDPGSWSSSDRVMAAILKIRLMHATIRELIYLTSVQKHTPWKKEALGEPICGEDLLGMLMGFAATPIRDLPKLGVRVTRAEADDHIYLWCVVGRFLGVDIELMPKDLAEAKGLVERVKALEQGEGPNGHAFARALIDFHLAITPGLDAYAARLIRDLVGSTVCRLLQIEPQDFTNASIEVPRPLSAIAAALMGVLPGRIRDMIAVPTAAGGGDASLHVEVPGTAAVKAAHAALKRHGTAELWGKALLAPREINTGVYTRPEYQIPTDLAARWEKKDKNWRQGPERLASRMS